MFMPGRDQDTSKCKKVDPYAFEGCENLKRVSISSGVTVLSSGLFSKCRSLTDIIIPHGVEAIHGNAFEMCDSLERIFIPQSVTFIMENAFDQRKRKKELIIQAPKGSYAIEYAKKMRFKYEYVEENPIA